MLPTLTSRPCNANDREWTVIAVILSKGVAQNPSQQKVSIVSTMPISRNWHSGRNPLVCLISSVTQLCLTLHGLQHARLPYLSPTPGAYSNSCPSSCWRHPTISSSVGPFSSHPQSFPATGAFQMSQFFTSGGQSIGVSASASVLTMNIQDWFPLGLTGLIFNYFVTKLKTKVSPNYPTPHSHTQIIAS